MRQVTFEKCSDVFVYFISPHLLFCQVRMFASVSSGHLKVGLNLENSLKTIGCAKIRYEVWVQLRKDML